MKRYLPLAFLISGIVSFCSCKKDATPTYSIPTTYAFANFNDSNELKVLAMADQLVAKINQANSVPNTLVTAQSLSDLFYNNNNPFNDSALNLNGSGLALSNYFSAAATTDMLNYFDSVGVYSQSTATASAGVAGVGVSSQNTSKKYLLSPNGVF